MTRTGVLSTIGTILAATNGDTTFTQVWRGEPIGITPGPGPFAAYWITGESQKAKTLGNVMATHSIAVACYWPLIGADVTTRAALELKVFNAMRDVQFAFRADSTLSGHCSDLEISLADVGYTDIATAPFRTLRFNLELLSLEEEAIAP